MCRVTGDSETIVVKLLRSLTGGLVAIDHESEVTLLGTNGPVKAV